MSEGYPSQYESNKTLRVLSGTKQKFTVRIHRPNGEVIECQSDKLPSVDYVVDDRCLWIKGAGSEYGSSYPMMRWEEGTIILCEENPK